MLKVDAPTFQPVVLPAQLPVQRAEQCARPSAECANTAASIRDRTGVSVADSHAGAVIQSAPYSQITVVTSNPGDMRLVAGDKNITVAVI